MLTGLWHSASCASERPVQRSVQHPVAVVDSAVAEPFDRSVLCSVRCSVRCIGASCAASCASEHPVQRPVQCPVTSVSLFLRDLASGLVPIFMLGLCLISWVFSCAPRVLLMVLIIGSSRRLRPSHVCNLLDYKTNTHKHISPIWCC